VPPTRRQPPRFSPIPHRPETTETQLIGSCLSGPALSEDVQSSSLRSWDSLGMVEPSTFAMAAPSFPMKSTSSTSPFMKRLVADAKRCWSMNDESYTEQRGRIGDADAGDTSTVICCHGCRAATMDRVTSRPRSPGAGSTPLDSAQRQHRSSSPPTSCACGEAHDSPRHLASTLPDRSSLMVDVLIRGPMSCRPTVCAFRRFITRSRIRQQRAASSTSSSYLRLSSMLSARERSTRSISGVRATIAASSSGWKPEPEAEIAHAPRPSGAVEHEM
jgi:hypothetical protein